MIEESHGSGIDWQDWGRDVFERAAKEDRLILLDSGATWCHWCHVMDRVTYEDPEVAALVRERFVPVRIDRDRLPDVDAQFQHAPALVDSNANGWPLTVVLTPQGHPLFKATFLPPRQEPRYGATTGLIDVLRRLDAYWRDNRDQLSEAGQELRRRLAEVQDQAYASVATLKPDLVAMIAGGALAHADSVHGGFGGAPKFFSAPTLELLALRAWLGDRRCRDHLRLTLDAMARGGVYDQVGGGFHRYSVDARWLVPHFEKMAYDNAALLKLYAEMACRTGEALYRRSAERSMAWIARDLTDPHRRGFYGSQDADVGLDDDGDFFTWTVDELHHALGESAPLAIDVFGVTPRGHMHDRPGRSVLHLSAPMEELAGRAGQSLDEFEPRADAARSALLQARLHRPQPQVDRTIFADVNGMMIDALLAYARSLGDHGAHVEALRVLDATLADLRDERGIFAHYRQSGSLRRCGLLADQAWMARALVAAYTATIRPGYLDALTTLADFILSDLSAEDGAFLSAPADDPASPESVPPRRTWEDSPGRSAATVAAEALVDLAWLTGQDRYAEAASRALSSFAGAVQADWSLLLGGYALAVDHLLAGPRAIVIVGRADHPRTQALARSAGEACVPGAMLLSLDARHDAHARQLAWLGHPAGPEPLAYVCHGSACLQPAADPGELRLRLDELRGI